MLPRAIRSTPACDSLGAEACDRLETAAHVSDWFEAGAWARFVHRLGVPPSQHVSPLSRYVQLVGIYLRMPSTAQACPAAVLRLLETVDSNPYAHDLEHVRPT